MSLFRYPNPWKSGAWRRTVGVAAVLFLFPFNATSVAGESVLFCGVSHKVIAVRVVCAQPSVTDLSPLKGMTNLRWLDLKDTKVNDLSPL